MQTKYFTAPVMVITALFFGGCAADGSLIGSNLTTASTTPAKTAAAPKIDPACVQLTARIDAIRKEGVVERVEKVGTGKSKTVSVYRSSLAKMAELDRANAEFQAKCSKLPLQTAAAAPAGVQPTAANAPAPAAKPATSATTAPKQP